MTRPDEANVSVYARAAKVNIWALQSVKNFRRYETDEIDRLIGVMQAIIDDPEENAAIYMNYPFDYEFGRKIHPDLAKIFEYENHAAVKNNYLMISLHSNATGSPIKPSVSGADAFYMSNSHDWMKNYYKDYSYEKQNLNFANKILSNIEKLGIQKRKAEAACYVVIREHNVPAVLIENGFHTNDADRAKLSDNSFLNKLAQTYADSVVSYFSEIEETAPMQYLDAKSVKLTLNGYLVKLTESPILLEGELYFCVEDIARITGNASDGSGILYRGKSYELKKPIVSGGKLFIGAEEMISIQKTVLWAGVLVNAADVRVKFKINKYFEPKWDGSEPVFLNGELCIPLKPALRALGYTAEIEEEVLFIYRKGEPIYSTESEYVMISGELHMTVAQLEAIKRILWASFDVDIENIEKN
jgi:hypothetical protein